VEKLPSKEVKKKQRCTNGPRQDGDGGKQNEGEKRQTMKTPATQRRGINIDSGRNNKGAVTGKFKEEKGATFNHHKLEKRKTKELQQSLQGGQRKGTRPGRKGKKVPEKKKGSMQGLEGRMAGKRKRGAAATVSTT